jgi:hypothetical protein
VESGIKNAVTIAEHNGVPTFSWIGAKQRRSQQYAIFSTVLPEGWRGTADVSAHAGRIVVTERVAEAGGTDARTITLKAQNI